jgi:hypothetical protein
VSKPGNILKTKGQGRAFSQSEAGNILNIKPLTKNCRNPKKAWQNVLPTEPQSRRVGSGS